MKKTSLFCTLFITVSMSVGARGLMQTGDSLGLPGDNLDLYGVLDLFKKSESPEAFEKVLNSSDTKLNNLDLNGDGETDYIRVIDRTEGELHALVLQIPVNEDEAQDVAVIEIEKKDDGTAHIQIVGDEELYGKDYILEPRNENKTRLTDPAAPSKPQSQNPDPPQTTVPASPPIIVNVWAWPSVRYVYGPVYSPWVSPWRWRHYPPYWRPWRPVYWHAYHPHWHHYHAYHHRVHAYNVVRAHDMYYGHRVVSRSVYQRRSSQPGSSPGLQERPRRSPEQRAAHRQRSSSQQPTRVQRPRGNVQQKTQPRQQRPRGAERPRGSRNTPRK